MSAHGAPMEPAARPTNILYLHPKQMEVYRAQARFEVL